VNHTEPATLCGNVVDRATPSPLSERCPRVALTYASEVISAGRQAGFGGRRTLLARHFVVMLALPNRLAAASTDAS
jgi:hypothetical protein